MPSFEDYLAEYTPEIVAALIGEGSPIAVQTIASASAYFTNLLERDLFSALASDNEAERELATVVLTYYLNHEIRRASDEADEHDWAVSMARTGADRLVRALAVSTQRPDLLGAEANTDLIKIAKKLVEA